jgi:3,4-dihydroxy 2-butanone 4-phosphate synthase/GTP cyclohydrolase II
MKSATLNEFEQFASPIEEIIEEARNGRMFVLVDDEDRENEGDLVIPAQFATPEAINFMAKHARGLICLALTRERIAALDLPLMTRTNASRLETAFTVSIEAREGVTTGISAPDRARTIAVAIDEKSTKQDIVTPGHVFPLAAREGGALERAGHTEAAVDIARLAGLNPSGVICEIMKDDGTMARRDDLISFAQYHNLKIGTIADLIAYRSQHDQLVQRVVETDFDSVYGGKFRLHVYLNKVSGAQHVALIKGDVAGPNPVLVRMHASSLLNDILGDAKSGRGGEVPAALKAIEKEGRGVVVIIREPNVLQIVEPSRLPSGTDTVRDKAISELKQTSVLRDYGIGAQILKDLGIQNMIILTNTTKDVIGIDGFGLHIVEQRPLPTERKS